MYIQTSSLKGSAATSQEPLWPIGNLGQAAKGANKFDECWEPQKNGRCEGRRQPGCSRSYHDSGHDCRG